MNLSFRLRFDNRIYLAVVCAFAGVTFTGCEPEQVREEKLLRRQLAHEMRSHSYESAAPMARRLIQLQPHDHLAWKRLVKAQIGLHDLEGAKETLADWRGKVQPPPPKIDEYEGDIAHEARNFPRALAAWRKAAAVQPRRRRVFEKIAALEQNQEHWSQAITAWTDSLKAKDNALARINRAVCQRRLRHWDPAFDDLHHAQKLGPDEPEVQRWSGVFERLGKFLSQIRELDAKVAALPEDTGLLADRALLLLHAGDPEMALDDCEAAMRAAPWAMRPRLFKAIALVALRRAKECDRLSVRLPLKLETLPADFLEMMSRLDSAISVEPKNPEHFVARAWQLNEIGQPMLALKDAETAAGFDPKSAGANAEMSYALTKLGRIDEAFDHIKTATELDSKLASAWQYRGELEMQSGNTLAAIDSLSHALRIQQTAAVLQKREECYRRAGFVARAEEDRRALKKISGP